MTVPPSQVPINLAFVLGSSTGGIGRHVRMLAAGCAARGLTVQVLGPARTDRDFAFGAAAAGAGPSVGFTAVEIADRPRLLRDARTIARLRRLLGAGRTDVVHAHGLRAGALAAIALASFRGPRPALLASFRWPRPALLASFRGPRPALVVTVHNAPLGAGVVYRTLELIVARRADSVLCVSADLEARMRAAGARRVGHAVVPAPRAWLAHADVSAETRAATRAELGVDPDRPLVLAVGRLAAQKGFGLLLDAATQWRDIRPEPLVVIVGEGPLAAGLESRATSLGLPVRFTGHRSDISALLSAADVFVLPSVWEGQSLILQEALRAAVPIVATRVGGNPDLAGVGGNPDLAGVGGNPGLAAREDAALLVPPGDARRLADAVRAVLGDPELAARLRKAAADRAHTLPSEDDAVAMALDEYRHVEQGRRPA